MFDGFEQVRPAPQFERETPNVPTATTEQPDLDAMASELQRMKIDAVVDAERTRPGLNGFLALVIVAGATSIIQFVAQYGPDTLSYLAHTQLLDVPLKSLIAVGAGLLAAGIAGLLSYLSRRRTQASVRAFEEQFISLGGTPLRE